MHPRQVRRTSRSVHLIIAGFTGFVVYARPVVSAEVARDLLGFIVIPGFAVSGGVMWQQAAIRRLFGRRDGTTTQKAGR